MTEDQHMQKAREIVGRLNQAVLNESDRAYLKRYGERCIATALSEAYRSGVEAERERAEGIANRVSRERLRLWETALEAGADDKERRILMAGHNAAETISTAIRKP